METDQSDDGPESDVLAQTYFRSINGDFVPDMLDIFEQDDRAPNEWDIYATEELETQLTEALENEDYELATKIRDELNRRNQN